MLAKSIQLCLSLYKSIDCSLPGSSVHGILQARILESIAMPSSRGSSCCRDQTCISCISFMGRERCHLGSPSPMIYVILICNHSNYI